MRRVVVMLVVAEVRAARAFFVIAIRCRCRPGELERHQEEQEDENGPTHRPQSSANAQPGLTRVGNETRAPRVNSRVAALARERRDPSAGRRVAAGAGDQKCRANNAADVMKSTPLGTP